MSFFHWFCRSEYREEIEGDLMEKFEFNSKKYNHRKANRLFIKEVVLLFRPSLIGNIHQLTNTHIMTSKASNKRFYLLFVGFFSLLFIPFIAMIFTQEVNWNMLDFIVAATLLGGTAICLEFIFRKWKTLGSRLLLASSLIILLLLVWAEMAVGILGTSLAGS